MSEKGLRPTFWRTCRALANEDRLRLFKAVVENEGRYSVRQYARLLGLQDDVASVYLRQMNARGLLGVRREHIKVFYNLNRDRTLPRAAELQKALVAYMRRGPAEGWEDELVRIFKGFTHFNRLSIILRLSKGVATLPDLERAAGTIVKSTYHHLRFLHAAGVVDACRDGNAKIVYYLKKSTHPVTKVLLRQVLCEGLCGDPNYNPKAGRPDGASRNVLAKIRREEGVTAANWKQRRGTGVSRRKLSSKAQRAILEV